MTNSLVPDTRSELDIHVRRSMLRYPSLFPTRGAVLRHLFVVCGNGYEWSGGRLVEKSDTVFDEQKCREEFFSDIDELAESMQKFHARAEAASGKWFPFEYDDSLARARRAFFLEHIDEIAVDKDGFWAFDAQAVDFVLASVEHSACFTVPDDAESSYRRGAEQTLIALRAGLSPLPDSYFPELREAVDRALSRLRDR